MDEDSNVRELEEMKDRNKETVFFHPRLDAMMVSCTILALCTHIDPGTDGDGISPVPYLPLPCCT